MSLCVSCEWIVDGYVGAVDCGAVSCDTGGDSEVTACSVSVKDLVDCHSLTDVSVVDSCVPSDGCLASV